MKEGPKIYAIEPDIAEILVSDFCIGHFVNHLQEMGHCNGLPDGCYIVVSNKEQLYSAIREAVVECCQIDDWVVAE